MPLLLLTVVFRKKRTEKWSLFRLGLLLLAVVICLAVVIGYCNLANLQIGVAVIVILTVTELRLDQHKDDGIIACAFERW